jgi:hypothetical protein
MGLAWFWYESPELTFPIAFDPASILKPWPHGVPLNVPLIFPGMAQLEALASATALKLGGLNWALWKHYKGLTGLDFDVTGDPTIRTETIAAVRKHLLASIRAIRDKAEKTVCTKPCGVEPVHIPFKPFVHEGFTSRIWVIRSATAALQDTSTALVFCFCNKPRFAIASNFFKIYFYDYFQDAVDLKHIIPGSQEFPKSAAFLVKGAWGVMSSSFGLNT